MRTVLPGAQPGPGDPADGSLEPVGVSLPENSVPGAVPDPGELHLPDQVHRYLSQPALQPVWTAIRSKLEGTRLSIAGSVTVTLDDTGADLLGGLLGCRV